MIKVLLSIFCLYGHTSAINPKWGNSQGLRFPRNLLNEAQTNVGDEVKVSIRKGQIIVEPVTKIRGRYDLKELVARMPENYRPGETDWGPPVGKEIG